MKRLKVRGKYWKARGTSRLPKDELGQCVYDTKTLNAPWKGETKLELDTIIHELLHAGYPDLNEDAVNEMASDIAEVLWKLNWRKQ